jgi:hypothetical protein
VHLGTALTRYGTWPCGFGAQSARVQNRAEIIGWVSGSRCFR